MKYKLLVLDLDGTLTNSQKEITPHTLDVLCRVQESGVKLVLASGRPTYGITPLAKALKMDHFGGYILAYNGGKIIDARSMEVLYEQILPLDLVPALYAAALEAGAVILTYKDQYILTENPEDKHVGHEVFLTKMTPMQVDNFSEAVDFDPDKCLIVGEPSNIIPLGDILNEKFGDKLSAYRSEPFFLEVVPKGIDKALSLKRLLSKIECTEAEMVAVGDGFNDFSMIQLAGFGVAMANAQDVVKEAASYVTLSNDEDGVAAMVEKYLLL
ncbi:MAG: Cof-type HAD-IIB family hydrolase [Rikenellaceae bacterium]